MDDFSKKILRDVNLGDIEPRAKGGGDQSAADHWSPAVLLERAAYLRKMAKYSNGSASETIKEFPNYSAGLSVLGRTGDAEVRMDHACFFHVLAGLATLLTGGTVTRARSAGAGEIRADSIEDGKRQELRQGDIVHVPAGVPHQFLISGDKAITLLTLRIQELK